MVRCAVNGERFNCGTVAGLPSSDGACRRPLPQRRESKLISMGLEMGRGCCGSAAVSRFRVEHPPMALIHVALPGQPELPSLPLQTCGNSNCTRCSRIPFIAFMLSQSL